MGLLDDAIREHLDLKRRRGADPDEVERAEREALGPVRRGREDTEDVGASLEPDVDPGLAYDHEEEEDWGDDVSDDEAPEPKKKGRKFFSRKSRAAPELDFVDEEMDEPEPSVGHEHSPFEEPTSVHEPAPAPAPEAPAEEPTSARERHGEDPGAPAAQPTSRPAAPDAEPAGGETVEYNVEAALEANEADEGDDVLEETPEFLQDTPDHDRLWFEQRPPRDFDFDG